MFTKFKLWKYVYFYHSIILDGQCVCVLAQSQNYDLLFDFMLIWLQNQPRNWEKPAKSI